MKISQPERRLFALWGWIDRQHNARIAAWLPEPAQGLVLDIGCGYGSLVNYLTSYGWQVEGIDNDPAVIEIGQRMFPQARLKVLDVAHLNSTYSHASVSAVTLKDCFHHLANEGDIQMILSHIHQVLHPTGKLVILDPNPTWIVRLARKLIAHHDPEATLQKSICLLEENGFRALGTDFFEVIGLPASGGYVGLQLIPNWKPLNWLVAALNAQLSALINTLELGHILCWRYMIWAEKKNKDGK